jgi:molybdate transport system substrate-binding protein
MTALLRVLLGALLVISGSTMSQAAEITIFTSMGSISGVTDLAAAFERSSGHKVKVGIRIGPALIQAIKKDEPGDIVANFTQTFPSLIKQGKVVAGTPVEFARAGVGVAVKKGAPKPNISTVDAFKAAMLAAKSIGYSKSGSGMIADRALAKLGIADQIKHKVRYIVGIPVAEFVANGEVEIGMQQTNALIPVVGVDYVGPLPGALQEYLYFSVGLLKISRQPEAARQFMTFMASPQAAEHLRKSGMEPPGR